MSDLTDNLFYPSTERVWLCIRLNNAGKWVYDRLTADADFGKKVIFSDEAHFDLSEHVSKQNCRIWGTENPHANIEKPTHPKRITVCIKQFLVHRQNWAILFENEQEEAITVNGYRYRAMSNEFLFTKIEEVIFYLYLVSKGQCYVPHVEKCT